MRDNDINKVMDTIRKWFDKLPQYGEEAKTKPIGYGLLAIAEAIIYAVDNQINMKLDLNEKILEENRSKLNKKLNGNI